MGCLKAQFSVELAEQDQYVVSIYTQCQYHTQQETTLPTLLYGILGGKCTATRTYKYVRLLRASRGGKDWVNVFEETSLHAKT